MSEMLLGVTLAICLGLGLGLIGGLDVKYQLAFVLGGLFVGVLVLFPERRLLCLVLWILIQPLSIEKVFYVNSIYEGFVEQSIVINVGDVLLVVLAFLMLFNPCLPRKKYGIGRVSPPCSACIFCGRRSRRSSMPFISTPAIPVRRHGHCCITAAPCCLSFWCIPPSGRAPT